MKALSLKEIEKLVTWTQPLVGLRLQEVRASGADLALGFYSERGLLWMWIDLSGPRPILLPWSSLPLSIPAQKTPLSLFLRAHFLNRILTSIEVEAAHGRVVELNFSDPRMEIRLFPHGANVLAFAGEKKIAWQKPRELTPHAAAVQEREPRDLETLRDEWVAARRSSGRAKKPTAAQDPRVRLQRDIEKKEKALAKVRDELERKREMPWRQAGEWMKTHQSLEVPKEFEPFVDRRRKLAWNIENCFGRAREVEAKLTGTEKRVEILNSEIENLKQRLASPHVGREPTPAPRRSPIENVEVKARTLKLDRFTVVAGKSAADNLKILRRARAWDLWFHLRDYPSQHAVLFRNKNETVSEAQLREVAAWFVRENFGAKLRDHRGEKFELIIAECRHVRPIKGDRIGRVTYHDERILIYQLPS